MAKSDTGSRFGKEAGHLNRFGKEAGHLNRFGKEAGHLNRFGKEAGHLNAVIELPDRPVMYSFFYR